MSQIAEEKLRKYMEEQKLDGFFISRPVNVKYISSYTGEDSYLLITQKAKYFITDPRYTEQVSIECPDYTIVDWRAEIGSVPGTAAFLANQDHLKNLAFEADHLTVDIYQHIQEKTKAELVPETNVVEEFRMHKNPQELEYLRASCEIAARAYEQIQKDIRPGVTEKELAANLSRYMVLNGSDTMPYGNILISGARTSLLHGIPSAKAVEYGDFVLMDYGCQYHGYLSDMTRTLVVGKATPEQKHVYELEQQMVADTEAFLKAGVSSRDAYYVSRKAIEGTKYLDYHYPSMGHGIGMFVHEMPFMSPKSEYILAENTVMTVEPGIYIPGWGGVRIEDTTLITKDGCENLTNATKELIEL
ncbi:M24 family metallopeptidase [Clostridium vitabionis]|uniref:M24 family metallopeptidase n=1 Tax=Clostridium vitabionis TaxID=2784388 RepID=UPI00188C3689|nr:Xaa-Pro peptidase family protein [Clostridium vitabionis]